MHTTAGVSSLVCALVLGKRNHWHEHESGDFPPSNLPLAGTSALIREYSDQCATLNYIDVRSLLMMVVLPLPHSKGTGAGMLLCGWFGFNAGSALGIGSVATSAVVSTQIAGPSKKKPSIY